MASSDLLDIWNDAILNATAKSAIASLTEQSAEAAACALRYPSVVRAILRDTDWNCVRRRVALVEAGAAEVWPPSWSYMYAYPTDCLRVRGFDLGLPQARFPSWTMVDYEVADDSTAGTVILLNITCPTMIYTSYQLDMVDAPYEAKFDAMLREAVGWALAAAIAGPLTGNRSIAADVRAQARVAIETAKATNANENAPNMVSQDCESLAVRGFADCWPHRGQRWPGSF